MGNFLRTIKDAIEDQPYSIKCAECGKLLKFTTYVDCDLDMLIDVEPCENCMYNVKQEAKEV
jgi:hypothetical protein